MKIHKHTAGMTLGAFLALVHALWAGLVFTPFGTTVVKWALALHFINDAYLVLSPFHIFTALLLVTVTFFGGYLAGFIFAFLWNIFDGA